MKILYQRNVYLKWLNFQGYLNNAEETKTMLTDDGWFKTGDMFYKDDQDYYYFVERKRLLIKHYGFLVTIFFFTFLISPHLITFSNQNVRFLHSRN